ncbi:helix-turn-helix domain-containing protein [Kitasatospora sp. NPDC015120]|uniref:helix-turn-helix domain-containing protein n=1 Tax=Kitasatospora sp. NPDC015120 TaxID=3364023 RepID=UPI0036F468D0
MAVQQTVRRRRLGAELVRLRDASGLNGEQVAAQVEGWSGTKLSRAENAKVAVKPDELARLLKFYNASEELTAILLDLARNGRKRGWWQSYNEALDDLATDFITLEADAASFSEYEQAFVPGLLQTADYAHAIIEALSADPDVNVEAAVEIRMARQVVLTRKDKPLELWAVIHESALRSNVGGDAVMADQLQRLLDRAKLPNVNIQIMPANAAVHPGMAGSFTIIGFPHQRDLDVVMIEGLLDGLWVEEPSKVEFFRTKFRQITAEAMPVEASLRFISEQKDRLSHE